MFRLLSYLLSPDTPTPGGRCPLRLTVDESLAQGHPGNTFYLTLWNHCGTHVDAPAHMVPDGVPITQVSTADLVFERPVVLDVPKADDELVTEADLMGHRQALAASDAVLIRTGFSRWRQTDPDRYRDHNPGLSASAARFLAQPQFAKLRAVGIDAVSIAATACLDEGIKAHHILFAAQREGPVLIIEDVDLRGDLSGMQRLIVAPLRAAGLDSSPCMVLAEFRDTFQE